MRGDPVYPPWQLSGLPMFLIVLVWATYSSSMVGIEKYNQLLSPNPCTHLMGPRDGLLSRRSHKVFQTLLSALRSLLQTFYVPHAMCPWWLGEGGESLSTQPVSHLNCVCISPFLSVPKCYLKP